MSLSQKLMQPNLLSDEQAWSAFVNELRDRIEAEDPGELAWLQGWIQSAQPAQRAVINKALRYANGRCAFSFDEMPPASFELAFIPVCVHSSIAASATFAWSLTVDTASLDRKLSACLGLPPGAVRLAPHPVLSRELEGFNGFEWRDAIVQMALYGDCSLWAPAQFVPNSGAGEGDWILWPLVVQGRALEAGLLRGVPAPGRDVWMSFAAQLEAVVLQALKEEFVSAQVVVREPVGLHDVLEAVERFRVLHWLSSALREAVGATVLMRHRQTQLTLSISGTPVSKEFMFPAHHGASLAALVEGLRMKLGSRLVDMDDKQYASLLESVGPAH